MATASSIPSLARILAEGKAVVCLTGDQLAAECGVDLGPWQGYRLDEIMTPSAFARDPELVWQYYGWRRERALALEPGPAHAAIARAAGRSPGFGLYTLEIEGFYQRSGAAAVVELHGSLWRNRCVVCHRTAGDDRCAVPLPPSCGECGGTMRPDVVWHGEPLEPAAISRVLEAVSRSKALLVAGTVGQNYPGASLVMRARAAGATVIEVNSEPTPLTPHAHHSVRERPGEVLPDLLA